MSTRSLLTVSKWLQKSPVANAHFVRAIPFTFRGVQKTKWDSTDALACLVSRTYSADSCVAVCGASRDRVYLQPADARRVWWDATPDHCRELCAAVRLTVFHDPRAVVHDGSGRDHNLSLTRISACIVHRARSTVSES